MFIKKGVLEFLTTNLRNQASSKYSLLRYPLLLMNFFNKYYKSPSILRHPLLNSSFQDK